MSDVGTINVPILATIPQVELIRCGTWEISTGTWNPTPADLAQAIAAQQCPAVRRPVLKLGHCDPRFDGEPAVGYIDNLGVVDDGQTLLGDYVGMPGWLASIAASAYPDRSIEGVHDYVCQVGHTHPFVLTAVALLGVTEPGVGNLESLQDVAALYGITASAPGTGRPVTATTHGGPMPRTVLAAVSVEDVRREYYETAPWSVWICEVELEPLQLIVCDDEDGHLARVPVIVGADDAITFGTPINVKKTYVDAPPETEDEVVASARTVFASHAESRPGTAPKNPAATPGSGSQKGAAMDAAKLRDALGLTPDASDIEVQAALAASGVTPTAAPATVTPPPAPAVPEGLVLVDAEQLAALQVAATSGAEARAQQLTDRREQLVTAAVQSGRIAPARRDHWISQLAADPGAETVLASLAPGLIPVSASGYAGEADNEDESDLDRLHPPTAKVV